MLFVTHVRQTFSQDRVQHPFVEQVTEVAIPVSSMTEQLAIVPKMVFHDRIQGRLPSKLSTCQVLRSFVWVIFQQCSVVCSVSKILSMRLFRAARVADDCSLFKAEASGFLRRPSFHAKTEFCSVQWSVAQKVSSR